MSGIKTSALGPGNPKKWGPGLWNFMYTMAATFDPAEDDPRAMQQFYVGLKNVLPCMRCRSGYAAVIARNPFPLRASTPLEMLRWMYSVHAQVQQHANLPMHETFEQVATRYGVDAENAAATAVPVRALNGTGVRVDGPISNVPRTSVRAPPARAAVIKPRSAPPPALRVAANSPTPAAVRPNVRAVAPAPAPVRRAPPAAAVRNVRRAPPARAVSAAVAANAARPRRSGCRRCGGS